MFTPVTFGPDRGLTAADMNALEQGALDGYSSLLDVSKFNGSISAAVAEACASGGPTPAVFMGPEDFGVTEAIEPTRGIALWGSGARCTRLYHAGNYTGPIIRLGQAKRGNQWESTVDSAPIPTYDRAADKAGLELQNFAVIDDDRNTPGRHGIFLLDTDDMFLHNVTFGMLTGTALKLGSDASDEGISDSGRIRECDFQRIRIYRCGSGSPDGTPDVPAFILQNQAGTGDGTNQNYFSQFRFVYNEGRFLIRGGGASGGNLRRTIFRDVQLHALADNHNWNPVKYFPFDLVTLEGDVGSTIFDGVMANGTKDGTAVFAMVANAHGSPSRLTVRNANTVNVGGDFCRVDSGDHVFLDGDFQDVAGKLLAVGSTADLTTYYVNAYGQSTPKGSVDTDMGTGGVWFNGVSV